MKTQEFIQTSGRTLASVARVGMLNAALVVLVIGALPVTNAAELLVPSQYPTIQAAVDAAAVSGDTVRIASGHYSNQIVIVDKQLTLAGEPGSTVIHATTSMTPTIAPYGQPNTICILGMVRSHVVLSGLTFDGEQLGDLYPDVLIAVLFRGSGGQVTNCTVRNVRGQTTGDARGINIFNPEGVGPSEVHLSVLNSTFENNLRSIVLAGDDVSYPSQLRTTFTIEGNTFTGFGPGSTLPHLGLFILTGAGGEFRGNLMTGYSYRGASTGFSGGILAQDGLFTSRGYLPVQPVRYEGNRFLTNDHHLVMISANASQVVSNTFQGVSSGWVRWGSVALSGTNVVVAHNTFTNLPIGIELFGGEKNGDFLRGVTTDPQILTNQFCGVPQPIRAQPLANGVQEQGTEACPNPPPRDLHVPAEFDTIQAAVDAANPGDRIHIAARDYSGQIVIANKGSLTLIGEPGTVIHAAGGMTQTLLPYGWGFVPLLGVFRSDVVLRDLAFDGQKLGNLYNGLFGIYLVGANGRLENCTVTGFRQPTTGANGTAGLRTQNAVGIGSPPVDIGVFHCTFENNELSLHIRGEPVLNPSLLRTTFTIEGNTITGVGPDLAAYRGIVVRNGASGFVRNNTIRNYSYTGTGEGFASGIAAFDDNAPTRTPARFVPLLPVRYEANTFTNNDEHLLIIGGNGSEVVNNIFQGAGPATPRWGALAISGTNIFAANNDFSDMPTGIALLGTNYFVSGWPLMPPAHAPALKANWFCNVLEPIRIYPPVMGLQEEGTETNCPFAPRFQSVVRSAPDDVRPLLRGWHGDLYVIEASTNLEAWLPIYTNLMALPVFEYRDADAAGMPHRFYRARKQ